jgi:hypothetical protein
LGGLSFATLVRWACFGMHWLNLGNEGRPNDATWLKEVEMPLPMRQLELSQPQYATK